MLKTFEIILDVEKELYTPSTILFSISTNDLETVELNFLIQQDGAAMNLTGNTVELAIKKPSGLTVYQECEIVDAAGGEARTILSLQSYNEYGINTAEIYIRNLDQLAVTSRFYYSSVEAIMNDETLESTNDWSAFLEVLFSYDKKPLVFEGVPVALPEYIGQMAVDTVGRRAFIAYDLTETGWQLIAAAEGGGGGLVYWTDILNKPLTFAPAAHTHDEYLTPAEGALLYQPLGEGGAPAEHTHEIADVVGLTAALDGKADNADLTGYAPLNHVHTFDSITNKPSTYTPAAHTHTAANITDFAGAVAANIPAEYLTTTEANATYQLKGTYLTSIPAEYLTQTEGDALYQPKGTYLTTIPAEYLTQTEGDARYAIKGEGGTGVAAAWGDIAGTLANQTDLQAALDAKADDTDLAGKANVTHTHTAANITDFGTAVAGAIPANYLTEAEGDTRYMAAGAAPTAHTHTAAQITDFATAVSANIPAAYLTQTEGDAAYQPKGDYLTAIPTHTHTAANITDFSTAVAANIPAEYLTATEGDAAYQAKNTVAAHTHTAANITDFGTAVAGAIPAEYLTQTEGDTRYMAAGAAPTAHTHTAAQITDFGTAVAANIPASYLTESEAAAAYQPKGTYLTAVPLMTGSAVGGAQVGNGLNMVGNYLAVKTGAGLGIAADNSLQVQTTRATPTAVKFWTGTAAEYTAIATKDANTLYFVTG